MSFKSGFIGIVGPPNVGKSTLLNRIIGTKLAIVSPKPQTTRNRILGVFHQDDCQMVFMDTPGIHRTRTALHKSMVDAAFAAFHEVDIILMMIEVGAREDPAVPSIINGLKSIKKPLFLAVNKIDKVEKERILPILGDYGERLPFDALIPISALKGYGVDALLHQLKLRLKSGPRFFPSDMNTDQSEAFMVSEIIREKIYQYLSQELPYSCAVTVFQIEDVPEKNLVSIGAGIHVETESQKGIFIGRGGKMIKNIGRSARLELEALFEARVYLDLAVRLEKNWSKDTRALKRLGY
ncbi:MAG: GTPase Era [Deltaproteobacteria bacterium]|nr:GTPase Era [Deltaproteobacteria bacterium]